MNYELKKPAFSLTEVLLAVGILAIGMLLVAGVFPVSIRFTTIATERTIAAIVADEAFAKIRLYAEGDPNNPYDDPNLIELPPDAIVPFPYPAAFPAAAFIDPNEFAYPSDYRHISQKQYFWSALCRWLVPPEHLYLYNDPNMPHGVNSPSRLVQVTIFVSRRIGANQKYPLGDLDIPFYSCPEPVKVGVELVDEAPVPPNILRIVAHPLADATGDSRLINDGWTIVDNYSGRIYRVLERDTTPLDQIILDRDWIPPPLAEDLWAVWVIPPPVGGGRYPCIAVYQKIIRF